MIPLHVHGHPDRPFDRPILGRIACRAYPRDDRKGRIRCLDSVPDGDLAGYEGVLASGPSSPTSTEPLVTVLSTSHLEDGDIVAMQPSGYVRTLFRISSPHNALFATDRCNSLCVMCSQPPRPSDDSDRVQELLDLVELIPAETGELGITGGEPTLLGSGLLQVIARAKERLPHTALHLLTNGRAFANPTFAAALAGVGHPDLVLGIPLYSSLEDSHDFVVQARGAYDETIRGLLNLARHGARIEIRVVLHRLTIPHLVELASFIYRNLTFVEHVALMGLEPMGFGSANFEQLWIDPFDYQDEIRRATLHLAERGLPVSIYNHPLCLLPVELWPFAMASISDWKRDYPPICSGCAVRPRCGGLFSSAIGRRQSPNLAPVGLSSETAALPESRSIDNMPVIRSTHR